MSAPQLPRVLCVDDDPRVLQGITPHLRKDYQLFTASNGAQALQKLQEIDGAAVVVSDMRMPGMDGATLLRHVMQSYPAASRILLTGDAGREAAVSAVNKGQIFRYLTKPCPPEQLRAAVEAGVVQHRLVNAERAVLQETLLGCIKALTEVLEIANPMAFGRASRVKRLAIEFTTRLECGEFWQLEAAAMLSQVGYLSLPAELVEKLHYGKPLTPEETERAAAVPKVALQLLEHIPRLEPVMQILTALSWPDAALARLGEGTSGLGARVLGLVLEYDALSTQGQSVEQALLTLRAREGRYGVELLQKFAQHLGATGGTAAATQTGRTPRILPLKHIIPGMIIVEDVVTSNGTLLVTKGFEVTTSFIARVAGFTADVVETKVSVLEPAPKEAT